MSKVITCNDLVPFAVNSGEEAIKLLKTNTYQLILLDIMLPGMDGFQVLKQIRYLGIKTPVIIISGKTEDYETLYGLDLGADNYIHKPFNPVILGAKIKALIRRDKQAQDIQGGITTLGPFSLDNKSMRFYKGEEEIFLSSKELILMKLLLEHPNQVFSREALYEQIWGNTVVDDNAIMVYINRLRHKIEENPKTPKFLQTIWGKGYTFSISS
jgi:DNA-binding response OmpR family regulator